LKLFTFISRRPQRKFIQYKASLKFKQIFRPSYKASRNDSSRDAYSRRRSAVTGVHSELDYLKHLVPTGN